MASFRLCGERRTRRNEAQNRWPHWGKEGVRGPAQTGNQGTKGKILSPIIKTLLRNQKFSSGEAKEHLHQAPWATPPVATAWLLQHEKGRHRQPVSRHLGFAPVHLCLKKNPGSRLLSARPGLAAGQQGQHGDSGDLRQPAVPTAEVACAPNPRAGGQPSCWCN